MPLYYLILLFIGLPILELALLLKIHEQIHFWPTFLLVVGTGVLGMTLVKRQGLSILRRIHTETAQGRAPTNSMIDGAMVLLAGALLVTPGLITDAAGFALLVPAARATIKQRVGMALSRRFSSGAIHVDLRGPNSRF